MNEASVSYVVSRCLPSTLHCTHTDRLQRHSCCYCDKHTSENSSLRTVQQDMLQTRQTHKHYSLGSVQDRKTDVLVKEEIIVIMCARDPAVFCTHQQDEHPACLKRLFGLNNFLAISQVKWLVDNHMP